MEPKVTDIKEEFGKMFVTLKNGKKIEVNAKTTYTTYDNGRQDCAITLEKPFELGGQQVSVNEK